MFHNFWWCVCYTTPVRAKSPLRDMRTITAPPHRFRHWGFLVVRSLYEFAGPLLLVSLYCSPESGWDGSFFSLAFRMQMRRYGRIDMYVKLM